MYFTRSIGLSALATGLVSGASLNYPRTPAVSSRQSCGASVDELVGFGAGTTGGGSGEGTTVTSCSELASAVAAGGVIQVSGILDGCGVTELSADTTLIGVGADSGFTNSGFRLTGISNVIIRNLKFHNPPEGEDIISLEETTQVWVDHCDLSSEGITGDKDHFDGLLDIKRASDFVTISWCKFSDHWKGSLIGHSDNNGEQDIGTLHVTYHHNSWTNINSRLPSIRFGTGHIYSSCFVDNESSGIDVRMGAQVLAESNSFTNTPNAIATDRHSGDSGFATERNNIFDEISDIEITQESSFEPDYEYTVGDASCVCDVIAAQGGPGVIA